MLMANGNLEERLRAHENIPSAPARIRQGERACICTKSFESFWEACKWVLMSEQPGHCHSVPLAFSRRTLANEYDTFAPGDFT